MAALVKDYPVQVQALGLVDNCALANIRQARDSSIAPFLVIGALVDLADAVVEGLGTERRGGVLRRINISGLTSSLPVDIILLFNLVGCLNESRGPFGILRANYHFWELW